MGIKVEHQPAFTPVAQTAYLVGEGDRNRWLTEQYQQDANRNLQAQMQAAQIKAQERARRDAARLARQEARDRAELMAAQMKWKAWEKQTNLRASAMQAEADRNARLNYMHAQYAEQEKQWEHRYSLQQKQKLAQYNDSLQSVKDMVESGELTPKEGAWATQSIHLRQAGIEPMKYPRRDTFDPQEWKSQNVIMNEDGSIFYNDGKGMQYRPPVEDKSEHFQLDVQKFHLDRQTKIVDMAREMVQTSAVGEDGRPTMSWDEAIGKATALFGGGAEGGVGMPQAPRTPVVDPAAELTRKLERIKAENEQQLRGKDLERRTRQQESTMAQYGMAAAIKQQIEGLRKIGTRAKTKVGDALYGKIKAFSDVMSQFPNAVHENAAMEIYNAFKPRGKALTKSEFSELWAAYLKARERVGRAQATRQLFNASY